jgi:hypothetical protein
MKVFLSLYISFCLSTSQAFASEMVWQLEQRHAEFGRVTILIGQDEVKIDNKTFNYQIVAKAPTWDVVMYRASEKKQCQMKFHYFTTTRVFKFLTPARGLDKPDLIKIASHKVGELKFTCYNIKGSNRESICLSDNIKVNRPPIDIVEAYYNVKPTPGVPVRLVFDFEPDGKKSPNASWFTGGLNGGYEGLTTFLQTDSGKTVPLRASDFNYPPQDYKHVKTASELMLSKNQQSSLDSVMTDLGLDGSKLGTGKK